MLNHEQLLALIRDTIDHPSTPREMLQRLKIPRDQRATFKRLLTDLVGTGDLIETRGNRFGLPDRMNLVVGRITTHPRGFGFVVPDRPLDEVEGDLYIAGSNLNQAMHGDRVVARIERITSKGAEGRILRILERGASTIVGRYDVDPSGFGFVVPFDRRMIMDVQIPNGEALDAKPSDMVVVEITRWPTPTRGPLGRVTRGARRHRRARRGQRDHHPEVRNPRRAQRRCGERGQTPRRRGEGPRHSRADRLPSAADRHDRRRACPRFRRCDHDRSAAGGNLRLGVHIADVAHYVPEGGALDVEAYERGTSVYFPERAVHMFPAELATGLCSLNPNVDRLVQSCVMEIDKRGTVVSYEMHDGVIHSDARMTYTDVSAILTDKDPEVIARYAALVPLFESMRELFEILNKRRLRRGSIDFDLKEPEIVLDDEGLVEEITAAERNIAHRIIEEFMLVANETVAQHLDDAKMPTLYRVHEEPDPVKVAQFEEFISTLGYGLSRSAEEVTPRDFQKLVERMRGTPEEKPIAFLMLRTMQKARYDASNLGHFGLAASSYTHFTSPIRRYPDSIVHRTLRESRHGRMTEDRRTELTDDLPEIARHTSERERRADDAERELVQWKKVRFMADKVGDEFDGYITGVSAFGLYIELVEHFVEGMVHVSTMADDYYRFVDKAHMLKRREHGQDLPARRPCPVQVVKVDMERRQIDLGLTEILDRVRDSERNRGPRRSKARAAAARRRRAADPRSRTSAKRPEAAPRETKERACQTRGR